MALEEEEWSDKVATAAFVTSLQDFRDLFPSESIPAGQSVTVATLAVLTVGITATAAAANERIIKILTETVRDCNGGIANRTGKSMVAGFCSGEDAAEASCLTLERLREQGLGAASSPTGARDVRMGLHIGPAVVAQARGAIEYSGNAVDGANHAWSLCQGADMILTHPLMECARHVLWRRRCRIESIETGIEGTSDAPKLWRVSLD